MCGYGQRCADPVASEIVRQVRLGLRRTYGTAPRRLARPLSTDDIRQLLGSVDRTAEGCTTPAAWCHAHHTIPWSKGGTTTVKDGRLVCPRHHRMIHHPGYKAEYLPNGTTRITRLTRRRQ